MKITVKVLNAIREAVENAESQNSFAEKLGVDSSAISRYLNGTTKSIKDDVWEKLKPILLPHLNIEDEDKLFLDSSNPCIKLCEDMESWEIEIVKKFKELPVSDKLNIHTIIDNIRKEALKNTLPTPIKTNQTEKAGGF